MLPTKYLTKEPYFIFLYILLIFSSFVLILGVYSSLEILPHGTPSTWTYKGSFEEQLLLAMFAPLDNTMALPMDGRINDPSNYG